MNRALLVVGGMVVVIAGIALYLLIGGDAAHPMRAPAASAPGEAAPAPRASTTQTPTLPPQSAQPSDSSGSGVKEYTVGGVRIRDHRRGNPPPIDVPPAIHPPDGRKIKSQLTSDLGQRVRGVMAECAASLPATARGSAPRLDGSISIAIRDRQAHVKSAIVQLRDVDPDAAAPVKQCIEQRAVGLTAAAADEADVDDYAITLSLRLR